MTIRVGDGSELDDVPASATVSPADIADAKRVANADAPTMRPAFAAELLPKDEWSAGPFPDEES